MWVARVLQVLVAVTIITTFITPEFWEGNRPRRVSDLVSGSSDLRAQVLTTVLWTSPIVRWPVTSMPEDKTQSMPVFSAANGVVDQMRKGVYSLTRSLFPTYL